MPGRLARMVSINSQNWRRDSGSTPVVGSSRIKRSGSWINAQHRPSFCFIPPDSLRAGRSRKAASPVLRNSSSIRAARSAAAWSNRRREEIDIFGDAELGIEIAAKSLGHVGDARADGASVSVRRRCRRRALVPVRTAACARRQSGRAATTCRRHPARSARRRFRRADRALRWLVPIWHRSDG